MKCMCKMREAKYLSYVAIKFNFVLLTLLSPTLTVIKRKKIRTSGENINVLVILSYNFAICSL